LSFKTEVENDVNRAQKKLHHPQANAIAPVPLPHPLALLMRPAGILLYKLGFSRERDHTALRQALLT
jgi:hypothetical protein